MNVRSIAALAVSMLFGWAAMRVGTVAGALLSQPAQAKEAAASKNVFGAGWTADSLANLEIGRFPGRMVSYRFRAVHSGNVSSIRVFFVFRTFCDGCYANGNGGQVRVQLAQDDDSVRHFPGKVISSALVTDPLKQWNRLVTLNYPVTLEAGRLYHLVFSNPLPTATKDYVSVDDLFTRTPGVNLQPSGKVSELAVLFKSTGGADWELKEQHVPIVSINFDDGYEQGQGYMDVKSNAVVVSDGGAARESFVFPDTDRSFHTLSVRIRPTTARGYIEVQLRNSDEQALLSRKITVRAASEGSVWETVQFDSPVTLRNSARYSVVVTTKDGAAYTITPLQKGIPYGFNAESLFTAGHCETKASAGWTGCLGRSDLDIPFYLQ